MKRNTIAINEVTFENPGERTPETVDRFVMAVAYHRASPGAVQALVLLTALACGSKKVVAMSHASADLDELETLGLIKWAARNKVVLL